VDRVNGRVMIVFDTLSIRGVLLCTEQHNMRRVNSLGFPTVMKNRSKQSKGKNNSVVRDIDEIGMAVEQHIFER